MSSLVDIFNKQLVPAIQQWAVLTKDYVLDLFWRYIQYTIVTDIIFIILLIWILYIIYIWLIKIYKYDKEGTFDSEIWFATTMYCFFAVVPFVLISMSIYQSINHLVQTIFVPELTIYEKIVELKR